MTEPVLIPKRALVVAVLALLVLVVTLLVLVAALLVLVVAQTSPALHPQTSWLPAQCGTVWQEQQPL